MANAIETQTMALGGVFQAAVVVDELAKHGSAELCDLETAINAVLNLEPKSYAEVFGDVASIRKGLNALSNLFAKNNDGVSKEVVQYAMALIAVQGKIEKRQDLMNSLSLGLNRVIDQRDYFNDNVHESVIGAAAQCYQNSVSKLKFRIRVMGNPKHLQDERIADRVRTLLLFGVRSAILWRQSGGRRWHFLVNRQKIAQAAKDLSDMA